MHNSTHAAPAAMGLAAAAAGAGGAAPMDIDKGGAAEAPLGPDAAMACLTSDPSKLSAPIKDIKDKWKLLPAFLQVRPRACTYAWLHARMAFRGWLHTTVSFCGGACRHNASAEAVAGACVVAEVSLAANSLVPCGVPRAPLPCAGARPGEAAHRVIQLFHKPRHPEDHEGQRARHLRCGRQLLPAVGGGRCAVAGGSWAPLGLGASWFAPSARTSSCTRLRPHPNNPPLGLGFLADADSTY